MSEDEKEKVTSNSEKRIESHLKQVYEQSMQEPMSDKLAELVAQLRKEGAKADG